MKILVLNGPNLDLLGTREPTIYGTTTLEDMMSRLAAHAAGLGVDLSWAQSNDEGRLVTRIGRAAAECDGLVINPAAFTHTSVAILDAVKAAGVPCVEVHLSNIHAREEFRRHSLTAAACVGQISGFGETSYRLGVDALVDYLRREKQS